jgi:hypothetical protein
MTPALSSPARPLRERAAVVCHARAFLDAARAR